MSLMIILLLYTLASTYYYKYSIILIAMSTGFLSINTRLFIGFWFLSYFIESDCVLISSHNHF